MLFKNFNQSQNRPLIDLKFRIFNLHYIINLADNISPDFRKCGFSFKYNTLRCLVMEEIIRDKGDKGTVLLSHFFIDIIHLLCYSKLG